MCENKNYIYLRGLDEKKTVMQTTAIAKFNRNAKTREGRPSAPQKEDKNLKGESF